MEPGRSRGLWEWEGRQQGGATYEMERWCPHSSVADNARELDANLSRKSTSPETRPLEQYLLALPFLDQGVQERVRVRKWG